MYLNLRQCWEASDGDENHGGWYVLDGGGTWASVEGFASQWREIAVGLRERKAVGFRRAALWWSDGFGHMQSPRNACSESDTILIREGDADELASHIEGVLRSCGEACMFADFDPIAMGC